MKIFEVLQILRLMHHVNHGFYIILPQLVSCGTCIWKEPRTARWMYSHILSLMAGVRDRARIALSISIIIPKAGEGRWPERMMLAVVIDGSGPTSGEDDSA
jgi:hypothetical protein